jgi:sec-independent protein translocase protein TatB
VFNIGVGELLLLAVLGLLVFGPDRLPEAVRRGSALLAQLRTMAVDARKQVSDAAGLDDAETSQILQDLQDLHPRRIAGSVLNPAPTPTADPKGPAGTRSSGVDPDLT